MILHSPQELASLVNTLRKKQALSQEMIADLSGLKQATVSAFENRPENTKLDTLFRILSAANLDLVIQEKKMDEQVKDSEW